jgi:hypothetical protein
VCGVSERVSDSRVWMWKRGELKGGVRVSKRIKERRGKAKQHNTLTYLPLAQGGSFTLLTFPPSCSSPRGRPEVFSSASGRL